MVPIEVRPPGGRHCAKQLLADLSPELWEEIVQHAAGVTADEWRADFEHRFKSKALVFDTEFRRLPNGSIEWKYDVKLPRNEAVRLVFDEVATATARAK